MAKKKTKPDPKFALPRLSAVETMCCPKCRTSLTACSLRLKPRRHLGPKLQKLLHRKTAKGDNVTERQQRLVDTAMQQSNRLVLKCGACLWRGETELQSRKTWCRQKSFLARQLEQPVAEAGGGGDGDVACAGIADKKARQRQRKKEKRKAAALSKALMTGHRSENSSQHAAGNSVPAPSSPAPTHNAASTTTPAAGGNMTLGHRHSPRKGGQTLGVKVNAPGVKVNTPRLDAAERREPRPLSASQRERGKRSRQQLQKVLSQQRKGPVSAAESLSRFLNSL